ncbi:MAG: glutathione S-transferase [Betaproteobacteria bacterium]|nr:glutathione S-transferase [Betaproteobacteria bacterium]
MYLLYYYPGNANLAPHILLEEIGAEYKLVLVDRSQNQQKSPEYLKLNPNGRIPVLVDGGLVLYEAAAICLHLADRHPAAALAPALGSDARAEFYKWLIYLTNTVQAELLLYFYPERMADAAAAAQIKAHAESRIGEMLDQIEAKLAADAGPFLLGAQYSAADAYLLMLCRWTRGMHHPARTRPQLGRFLDMMMARPATQGAFAGEGIDAPFY